MGINEMSISTLMRDQGNRDWLHTYFLSQECPSASSDFLFARPSVVYGIGRLLDLGAFLDLYNESLTPAMADALALYSDWNIIGNDMRSAFEAVLKELLKVEREKALKERTKEYATR